MKQRNLLGFLTRHLFKLYFNYSIFCPIPNLLCSEAPSHSVMFSRVHSLHILSFEIVGFDTFPLQGILLGCIQTEACDSDSLILGHKGYHYLVNSHTLVVLMGQSLFGQLWYTCLPGVRKNTTTTKKYVKK